MQQGTASGTAYRVALRRAAHQRFDTPHVFADPLALQILGAHRPGPASDAVRAPDRLSSAALRAFLVARARLAEDTLTAAVLHGPVTQYVLLGAGLDTFAYRNPHPQLAVFEVDHPDTQRWKLHLLESNGIAVPEGMRHVPVDFHTDRLEHALAASGFQWEQPAMFAWLGVVPYLSHEGFAGTLQCLAQAAAGSMLLFDYGVPREALSPTEQQARDSMASRVAATGEPFQLFMTPDGAAEHLRAAGWQVMEDLGSDELNLRYFQGRADKLRCAGSGGRMVLARHA